MDQTNVAPSYALDRLSEGYGKLCRFVAGIGVLSIVGIAFLTLFDVVLRSFFDATIPGLNEVLILCLGIAISACMPQGASRGVHLSLTLMTNALPRSGQRTLRLLGALFLLFFIALVSHEVFKAAQALDQRNQGTIILGWPVAPFHYVMAAFLIGTVPAQLFHVLTAIRDISLESLGLKRLMEFAPSLIGLAIAASILAGYLYVLPGYEGLRTLQAGIAALIFFCLMWIMMILGVPLAASMGLIGFLGTAVLIAPGPAATVVGTEAARFLTSETLAVLPLFLLMGSFASTAGLSSDIYRLAHELLRPLRGSLAHATIAGCAGFGALTGSSLATAATFGKVALPEMESRNYDKALASGSVAAGGTLGSLVPPSTALILFALLSEQSIGRLFVAAMIPALLAITLYLATIKLLLTLKPDYAPKGTAIDGAALLSAATRCLGAIFLFGTVIGSIYTGIVTDAEAASVGTVGAFLFALFRGRLGGGRIWQVMAETTTTIAMIYMLIFGAVTFSFLIAFTQVPALLSGWVVALDIGPYGVVAILIIVYLLLGMVMDSYAMMVITVPVFLPLIMQYGFDPIWWGIVTVICVELGMITPPFGMNIFMLASVAKKTPLTTIYKGVLPFVAADLVKVVLIVAFPIITLWLPSQM